MRHPSNMPATNSLSCLNRLIMRIEWESEQAAVCERKIAMKDYKDVATCVCYSAGERND